MAVDYEYLFSRVYKRPDRLDVACQERERRRPYSYGRRSPAHRFKRAVDQHQPADPVRVADRERPAVRQGRLADPRRDLADSLTLGDVHLLTLRGDMAGLVVPVRLEHQAGRVLLAAVFIPSAFQGGSAGLNMVADIESGYFDKLRAAFR